MGLINIESEVFTAVKEAIDNQFKDGKVFVVSEYVQSPPSFPCVSLVEIDNATYRNSQTQNCVENHATMTYELNIYSNKTTEKKAQCRKIAAIVDNVLAGMNFTRMMLQPVSNQNDPTIYRMLGRYRAVISKEKQFFRT
jgi:hypothetical protein